MLNKLFPNSADEGGPVEVEPMLVADVRQVRQSWLNGFSREELTRHVELHPHFCWWVRRSGDYIVGEPWRRRSDIGCIAELNARGPARDALTARLFEVFVAQGYQAVVLGYHGGEEYAHYYANLGFSSLERVVYYEKPNMQLSYRPSVEVASGEVSIEPLKPDELSGLIAVDHAAFPWLWWNSREEMAQYQAMDNVGIYLARYQGQALGYFSYTLFERWGHLDRIAVDPRARGLGLGAAQLARAIAEMRLRGVQRVTLSTQETNTQSRKLYEGFGFRLTSESYHIYGKMLTEPED
jgi:ribosomal protein S18 acetylase RimI-like enzyme